jgi:beta-barrel assembly-enhancing protease
MKILGLALLLFAVGSAQIPGIPNVPGTNIKDKIEQKTKPVVDRGQRAADTFTAWTPEEEQQIGEAAADKMVAIFGLMNDPALQKYVSLVGQAVARFAPRSLPYRFGILDTDIVGAFALPSGYIFITRRALSGMANEAQLAGTLGHEIEHASARHLETEIRGRKTSAWATEESSSYTTTYTNRVSNLTQVRADALIKDLFDMKMSRDKEDDADERGTVMAVSAGYAGDGLLESLKLFAKANTEPANRILFGQMLSTHPSFEDRIAHLERMPQARKPGETLEARFNRALGR